MNQIIENLKAFNRKERFFLVGAALGNPQFKLCPEFINDVNRAFGIKIPEEYFAAMDYHLDWVYASLIVSKNGSDSVYPNVQKMIHASCEDMDFIVAFEDKNICHINFLEAKGVTLFSNKQLQSKMARLSEIFGKEGEKWPGIVPHFAIVSPIKPQKINIDNWPKWAKPDEQVKWIPLGITHGLKKVIRCNQDGKADNKGRFWVAKQGEF